MTDYRAWTPKELFFAFIAVLLVLFVNGAMPFFMTPTLGQAVWSMGFAESLAKGPLLAFHAHHFGIPDRAAIAFGLAGAWPASLLIRLGLHAADAYAAMVTLWLGLAMWSAYRIARGFGAARPLALLAAVAWMTMPIIWAHAGYSMLSLGIALLPFYFLAAYRLFLAETPPASPPYRAMAMYAAAAVIAIFMDGYTFMMYASGASILLLYSWVTRPAMRPLLSKVAAPVHLASFAFAYLLFTLYVGKGSFESQSMEFFRGWGLDLSFVAVPTSGVLWLADLLGFGMERSDARYFGDASVWTTTFALPLAAIGIAAWWRVRRHVALASGVLLVALFGFYMALGPSLKIDSTKPEALQRSQPRQASALMPAELAIGLTGNAWMSEKLPGFKVMRASYRWSALGMFGLWMLVVIWAGRDATRPRAAWLGLLAICLLDLPHLQDKVHEAVDARNMFQQIDRDLVTALKTQVRPTDTVAFIPWRNDFMANYLAPKVGFRTFNIGGDKNLQMAQAAWPAELLQAEGELDADKARRAVNLLLQQSASVLLVPYFHMLWSPHLWVCPDQTTARLSERQRQEFRSTPGFICPAQRKAQLAPVIDAMRQLGNVDIMDTPLFAVIRLRAGIAVPPAQAASPVQTAPPQARFDDIAYPVVVHGALKEAAPMFKNGWHEPEVEHIWSQAKAQLLLPVPPACGSAPCFATITYFVFGASAARPVNVLFDSTSGGQRWDTKVVAVSGQPLTVKVPLTGAQGVQELAITVPEATSPQSLAGSPDPRVLGIAVQRIDLQR
jgi:hypothetical protein